MTKPFSYTTICYDSVPMPDRALDIFTPDQPTRKAAILFVHGGGWSAGARSVYHPIMHALIEHGWVCGSLDYRLSGVTALDQLDDVRLGRALFAEHLQSRGNASDLVLVGSSAGGHLALLEGMTNHESKAAGIVTISAPMTFEPWDEMFPPIWDSMCAIAGQSVDDNPELYRHLSPYHHISENTPPICLLDGANEHMFPLHLAHQFIAKMKQHGRPIEHHIYANAEHGFFYNVTRLCQQKAFKDFLKFLERTETSL